jgi:hypothetical protein
LATVPAKGSFVENKVIVTGDEVRPCDTLASETCMVTDEGEVGAVYRPEDEIVPVVGEPPATPLTIQVGFARLTASPVAVNCSVWPGNRSALEGLRVAGLVDGLVEAIFALVQPKRMRVTLKRQINSKICV